MNGRISRFNRYLLIVLIGLYLLSIGRLAFAGWSADHHRNLRMYAENTLIFSIPLITLYGSIFVLIRTWWEHRLMGEISPRSAKILQWSSRIGAILAVFLGSLLSLEAFSEVGTIQEKLIGFALLNLPGLIMITLSLLAWRWRVVGFVAYLLAGLAWLGFFVVPGGFWALENLLLISAPLLLVSALFFADWRWHPRQPSPSLRVA